MVTIVSSVVGVYILVGVVYFYYNDFNEMIELPQESTYYKELFKRVIGWMYYAFKDTR